MLKMDLRRHLNHQAEVTRLLDAAGATKEGHPVLSQEELFLHGLAVTANVTPGEFVDKVLTMRKAAAVSIGNTKPTNPALMDRLASLEGTNYGEMPEDLWTSIGLPSDRAERVA